MSRIEGVASGRGDQVHIVVSKLWGLMEVV